MDARSQVILFLDDNPARHAFMDQQYPDDTVIHVYDIDTFRSALKDHDKFDLISLDHDLNDFTEEFGFCSLLWNGEKATGLDACGYMMGFKEKLPEEIIVHSSCPDGASGMVSFLVSKGIKAFWKMFPVA
jgi:hypothetical protein